MSQGLLPRSFRIALWLVAVLVFLLQLCPDAYAHTSSSSIPLVSQYEFLTEPVVHRFGTHSRNSTHVEFSRRSFNQQLPLAAMIDDGTFHIQVRAYNVTYSLVVEPNHDLVHPDAVMSRTLSNGQVVHEPIPMHDIGVYRGHVLRTGPVKARDMSESLHKWEMSKRNEYSFDAQRSWVRLSVFLDDRGQAVLDGSFGLQGEETFYIKPAQAYMRTRRSADPMLSNPYSRQSEELRVAASIVYRQSDLIREDDGLGVKEIVAGAQRTCGAMHSLPNNVPQVPHKLNPGDPFHPVKETRRVGDLRSMFSKRAVDYDKNPDAVNAGCLAARKVIYMGAAADCSYVTKYQSQDNARQQILSNWNQASAVYERQLNVALGLISLQIEELTCPNIIDGSKAWNRGCTDAYPINQRLSDFSSWRSKRGDDGCGLWHLMTNCPTGTEVGLAWLSTMCMTTSSENTVQGGVSSGTGVSAVSRDEWKVVAHEIGHNFGASHDCTESDCATCSGSSCTECCPCGDGSNCDCKGRYIMNPTSPVSSDDFSPCSIRNMCATIKTTGIKCLQDPGKRSTLSSNMCGNGIKEKGEECDCGTSDECKNDPCCDASTCKLKAGAQCADANDLCCKQCKIVPKNTVCRPQYSECDVQEVCDGESSECPPDSHVKDGASCGKSSGLECASGQCTSRDAQCAARGGSTGLTKRCTISMGGDLCDFQCSNPNNLLECVFMSGSFMDGTQCGFHARCRSGTCKGENGFYQFLLLFQRNLSISIPVTIAVALILISIICCSCCRFCACCSRYRPGRFNKVAAAVPMGGAPQGAPQVYTPLERPRVWAKLRRKSVDPAQLRQPQLPVLPPLQPQPTSPNTPASLVGHNAAQNMYNPYSDQGNYNNLNNSVPGAHNNWIDPQIYNGPSSNYYNDQYQQQSYGPIDGSRNVRFLERPITQSASIPPGNYNQPEEYPMTDFSYTGDFANDQRRNSRTGFSPVQR